MLFVSTKLTGIVHCQAFNPCMEFSCPVHLCLDSCVFLADGEPTILLWLITVGWAAVVPVGPSSQCVHESGNIMLMDIDNFFLDLCFSLRLEDI